MKLERYFKQFIGDVLRRFTKRLQFLYATRNVFIDNRDISPIDILFKSRGEREMATSEGGGRSHERREGKGRRIAAVRCT